MNNKNWKLKAALLSACLVTASLNAITANIPEMAKSFPDIPLYVIELITTVPSLSQMLFVLAGRKVSEKIGYKKTILFGLLLCGFGGVLPLFIQNFYLLFVTRCVFGAGCGLILSTLLTLIIIFFTGETRSTMIGLQGSIGGLGSALAVFVSGRLLPYGWNYSFAVYFTAFAVFVLMAFAVPNVKREEKKEEIHHTEEKSSLTGLIGYAVLMLISVMLATLFIIKISTVITGNGYGTSQDGSTALTILSLGSLFSGAMYSSLRRKAGRLTIAIVYLICAAGFALAGVFNSMPVMIVSSFLMGYGYMAFVPYIQEDIAHKYSDRGERATSFILVMQSLGAFAAPYLGKVFSVITSNLNTQFLIGALYFAMLACIGLVMTSSHSRRISSTEESK